MKAIGVVLLLAVAATPGPSRSADATAPAQRTPGSATPSWTADQVRDFVLGVERELTKLQKLEFQSKPKPLPTNGTCDGEPLEWVIQTSVVMPRLKAMIGGKALPCYVTTYLGCAFGAWIGRGVASQWGPLTLPFTLSKVTIVEQTPAKVVADVVEAPIESIYDGVAKESDGDGHTRPSTEEEMSGYTTTSRYTITRGKDGVWRVTDRKPPYPWQCESRY